MAITNRIPPNMKEIRVNRVKTPYDMWEQDKELLSLYHEDVPINWGSDKPTQDDFRTITEMKQRKWLDPDEPFEVNSQSISQLTSWLMSELEEVWKAKFREQPNIEVVTTDQYLPRLQELDAESARATGYGDIGNDIPTAVFFPIGVLVIPERYMPKDPYRMQPMELVWDKPYLEQTMSEELSHVLFRQLRWECKEDYGKVMGILGPDVGRRIKLFNEMLAQHAKERLAKERHQKWALYVIAEKLLYVYQRKLGQWEDQKNIHDYIGIDALSQRLSLSEIAMIDNMIVPGKVPKVYVSLNKNHVYYSRKWKIFRECLNR